jgi:hypothetical protein
MSVDPSYLNTCVESLRRDGLISEHCSDTKVANEWRAAVRRACRAKHLRVRTFLVLARCDEDVETGVIAYAHHIDHVVTDAERRAVAEAVGDFLARRSTVPFAKRVHMAQRKMMRVATADK